MSPIRLFRIHAQLLDEAWGGVVVQLIYLQAGTRQEPKWVINVKPAYCRSQQTIVLIEKDD